MRSDKNRSTKTSKQAFNLFVLAITIVFSSCSNDKIQTSKNDLTPIEFSKKTKENASSPIVDVRTPDEFSEGHLENAKNINWKGKDFEKQIDQFDKSTPTFVYCKSGGRSTLAAEKMRSMGFKDVYELKGGISEWREKELPVEK
ncbi:MAG TPA: rhodanese-like domain-containing protein [Cytophagaceae bacterium]|jgi:thioredoxin 1|nr:rhodanese-like domain-containing protein [Cytophagaceae bacterium]